MSLHIPVLVEEVITGLNLKPGDNVVDATLGGGGHASALLKATGPSGKLLGIDADSAAIERAKHRLAEYQNRIILKQGNYADIAAFVYESGINPISAVLLDLGLSRDQLSDEHRGFGFATSGELDMRFSDQGALTAGEIVNTWSEDDLTHIFRIYGEERHAARAAKTIVAARKRAPIRSVPELVELVMRGVGRRGSNRTHPATRIFQALRIATNHELENLEKALPLILSVLAPGGRLAVISYHSLEDRMVKHFFKRESLDCVCPPELPLCRCAHEPALRIVNKKIIVPKSAEVLANRAARSAKLRIAEKR